MAQFSYRRHRFPAEIIQHAIWLYLRFTLSYRDDSKSRLDDRPAPQRCGGTSEQIPAMRDIHWCSIG
jgi:hypothetical protein